MQNTKIIGNDALKQKLFGDIKRGKPASCYIIEGADGTGKLTIARLAAAALCCENKTFENEPCLSCRSCSNILSGEHVDVHELRPEEKGKNITVDAVRELIRKTFSKPSESQWRVFIIEDSEMMRVEAQNALLKVIEEPEEGIVFLLLTNDKSRLLPTVRSRAVKLTTQPLPDTELKKLLLEKYGESDNTDVAVLLSGGSVGLAYDISENDDYREKRDMILKYFEAICDGAGFSALSEIFSPVSASRQELVLILPMMKLAIRDILNCLFSEGGFKPCIFSDMHFLKEFCKIVSPKKALKLFSLTESLIISQSFNVNTFAAVSSFNLASAELTSN